MRECVCACVSVCVCVCVCVCVSVVSCSINLGTEIVSKVTLYKHVPRPYSAITVASTTAQSS